MDLFSFPLIICLRTCSGTLSVNLSRFSHCLTATCPVEFDRENLSNHLGRPVHHSQFSPVPDLHLSPPIAAPLSPPPRGKMQPEDYAYHYSQPPAPPPASANHNLFDYQPPPSSASAPPFSSTTNYSSSSSTDYSTYPQNSPTFPPSSDPVLPLSSPIPQPPHSLHYQPPQLPYSSTSQYSRPHPPEAAVQFPPPPVQPQPPPNQYLSYDPHSPVVPSYLPAPPVSSTTYPNFNANSSLYPAPYDNVNSSVAPMYEFSSLKLDDGSGYFDGNSSRYGSYGRSSSELGHSSYGNKPEARREGLGVHKDDDRYSDGAYLYAGNSEAEPYGARGTASKSSTWSGIFDDYGRAISFPSEKEKSSSVKVVKAVPKADTDNDVNGGVQKFRVKLLPESGGQNVMEVLCMVGLDGIRMLDPGTSRTLRIYPLENLTRCEKYDSSTIAFWSKTSVDIDPRRIRLQSNSYTTNTILDTVTAAMVQFKEMGLQIRPSESSRMPEKPAEKKKGLADWVNLVKPANEEKDHWIPDEAVSKCTGCGTDFSAFVRRHHCRNCGDIFCNKCTLGRSPLTSEENAQPVRVCDRCMAEVTQRLSTAKAAANRPAALQSHDDLAKKLQEEMERNRRASSGSKTAGGRRMREVACPTCTVHLQVQVPASGSETIECSVCQHPFVVNAH